MRKPPMTPLDKLIIALRNPVGRSLAIRQMDSRMRTILLKLVERRHGDRCKDDLAEAGDLMTIIGMTVTEHPDLVGGPEARIIAGAVSACADMIQLDRWDARQLGAIEVGIQRAIEMVHRVSPKLLTESAILFQLRTNRVMSPSLRNIE